MRFVLPLLSALLFGLPALAGPLDAIFAAPAKKPAVAAASNGEESARLAQKLQQNQQQLAELAQMPDGSEKNQRNYWLELSGYAYRNHLAALTALQALTARGKNDTLILGSEKPSDNNQRQALQQLSQRAMDNFAQRVAIQTQGMENMREELQRAQADQRKRQEQLEALDSQSPARGVAAKSLELAQMKTEAWSAILAANDAHLRYIRARQQELRARTLELQSGANSQAQEGIFNPAMLTEELTRIDRQQQQYNKSRDQLDAEAQQLQTALSENQRTLAQLQPQQHSAKADDKAALAQHQQQLEQQQYTIQQALESNALRAGVLSDLALANMLQRVFLQNRAALTQAGKQADLQHLYERSQKTLKSIGDMQRAMQNASEITQDQIARLQQQTAPDKELLRQWQLREASYRQAATDLRRVYLTFERWLAESLQESSDKTMAVRADFWTEKLSDTLSNIWTLELFSVDETVNVDGQNVIFKRSVTIGKVLIALMLMTLGFGLCVFIANRIEQQLAARTAMAPVSIRIAKRWLMSVIFIILLLNALMLVRIPLTAFAFLGGAIAIGLGFGTQTLLKNLISGLMMLIERPFKPGDTVEVGGLRGTVVDMNVRAAVLRDVNGIETLVPNATFLEQNVTNWTYSSNIVRQGVKVGVAYGSDVRQVAALLEEDVARHGQTLKDQKTEILLENFGPDALEFGVYYWIDLGSGTVGRQVASDLRFMIEASLRKNGIAIAFPQRDLHVDMSGPLRVQLEPAAIGDPAAHTAEATPGKSERQ